MTRRARPLRLAAIACLAALGLTTLPSSSVADEQREGRNPGLPYPECVEMDSQPCESFPPDFVDQTSWLNFPQVGLAGSIPARQWTRVPLTMVAASIQFGYAYPGEQANDFTYYIRAFFTSPSGSKHPYGDSALIPIRTVVFGSIPVTATLQVSQRRDGNGLPYPLIFQPHDHQEYQPRAGIEFIKTIESATLEDRVDVRVRDVTVDGVDLRLGSSCGTGPTAQLSVSNRKLVVETPYGYESTTGFGKLEDEFDPKIDQFGIQGGALQGTLDIPAFTGCATASGDDISPILTAAVSGPDNPLMIRVGATNCTNYGTDENGAFISIPNQPGVESPDDPRSGCSPSPHPNPRIVTVPDQFEIPDYAPGEEPND